VLPEQGSKGSISPSRTRSINCTSGSLLQRQYLQPEAGSICASASESVNGSLRPFASRLPSGAARLQFSRKRRAGSEGLKFDRIADMITRDRRRRDELGMPIPRHMPKCRVPNASELSKSARGTF